MTNSGTAEIEQLDAGYFQDPHGCFARLRGEGPVTQVRLPDGHRVWLVTRYADVRAALADPRLYKDWAGKLTEPGWEPDPVTAILGMHMLNTDPPDHTRLRKLVNKVFTARRIARLRPRIGEITASLIDAMADRVLAGEAEVDLIKAFAFPLPITVICELLGVPAHDQASFKAWTTTVLSAVEPQDEILAAGTSMYQYLTRLIAEKRESPADDLVSALITARDSGDTLNERELVAMLFLLLIAGHETTVNLIASGTLALLQNPDELERLRKDPALLPRAVDELLRYCNPLNHATDRFTLEPVEIGGVTIPAREWVVCATAAANLDPDRFADPGRLDVGRDTNGHLAFGYGIHFCIGAPLARLEAEIAIGALLLSRFPGLSLAVPASALHWKPSSLIHGLESLPVRLL